MKKIRLAVVLGLMMLFILLLTPTVTKADTQIPVYEDPGLISNLDVKRDVYVENYGIVKVIDNFTIKNIGEEVKSYVQIGIPKEIGGIYKNFDDKLTSIECFGKEGESLYLEKLLYDGSGIQKWNIYLLNPLYDQETTSFRLEMVFYNLMDYSVYTSEGYKLDFYEIPSSAYPIENYELEMHRPTRSSSATSVGSNETNINPWSAKSYTWYYKIDTSSHSIIECIYGKREIRIDSWGFIQVLDYYRIKNLGDANLLSFIISIPSNIINGSFRIYDTTSSLIYDESYPDELSKNLLANITVQWSQSRNPLIKNQETNIWMSYKLPLEQYVSLNGDKIMVSLDLIINQAEWPIKDFTIELYLPTGATIITFSSEIQSITNNYGTTTLSNYYEIITLHNQVQITLEYLVFGNFFWAVGRPLLFVIISIIALAAYIIVRREVQTEKIILTRPKLVASAIIREFVSLYSEKIALDLDLEKLENNFSKGKIKKRIFRTQFKIIERKMLDLNDEIKELAVHFSTAGGRFKQIIENLDLLEAEKIHAKDGILNLEKRYKMTGRISSTAFQKLRDDGLKRITKLKSNIDKIIEELRSYIV
ncbi:MAG: hypothetical protein EAX96_07420 [Candidatus Lokiarchaeota archaeon]|nr:hypothetical protein [Candidatus Lokiarchaeota archaeon]